MAAKAESLLLESLVHANVEELFPGLEIQEDGASDLLASIEQEVRRRRFGAG